MSNFDFLNGRQEFSLFAASAVEAEKVFATSSAMCVIGCRKALELAVKWVYTVDKGYRLPIMTISPRSSMSTPSKSSSLPLVRQDQGDRYVREHGRSYRQDRPSRFCRPVAEKSF